MEHILLVLSLPPRWFFQPHSLLKNITKTLLYLFFLLFSERMSEFIQEELILEKFEMKREKASIKEHSSTLKDAEEVCTVYVQEEDVKMEGIIRNTLRF